MERNYLIVALDASFSSPGIVFKTLIHSLAASCRITLLCQDADPALLRPEIRLIPLHHGVQSWRRAEKKWMRLGCNPRDVRWARRTFRRNRKAIFQERYDALIVLTSNGYYSGLDLGKILHEQLRCPYIIYSVDGMPSPLPWLDGNTLLHRNISTHLREVCAGADLFLLANPQMVLYQRSILPEFKGQWDYLFLPFRALPADFAPVPHEGFNILYAGTLYGLRKIDGVVDAFRQFLSERPDARLLFVGGAWKQYKAYAPDLVRDGKLIFKDPTDRIEEEYARADCLLDIAADIPDDVFLSGKVICYLPYDKPIIAVSGDNSPVSRIMGGVPSILQCHNRADEILAAFRSAQSIRDCSDRKPLLEAFSPENICARFRAQIEGQLSRREPLVVSLTSWKARLGNIPAVLDTIFAQTLPPDRVVLNLAVDEVLPDDLQAYLDSHGVEVLRVPDTKVYKKLIPTLKKYPEACVVSIDDDWLYPREMLADFMHVHQQYPDRPVSGNRITAFHLPCHCGCASLTKRAYFGPYLDWIDEEVMRSCPSDDIVYTYFARKNGLTYVHTDQLYFDNMTPYNPSEPYSFPDGSPVMSSWAYLKGRFGLPAPKTLREWLSDCGAFLFEVNRDPYNFRKYLRVLGVKIFLEKAA